MPGTTLFSDIRITLHTRVAARLWQAHPTGMLLSLALLRRLLRAEEADDPWAAHWLKQLRIRLNLIAHLLKQKNRRLDQPSPACRALSTPRRSVTRPRPNSSCRWRYSHHPVRACCNS